MWDGEGESRGLGPRCLQRENPKHARGLLELCVEAGGTETDKEGGSAACCSPKEQMFGNEGAGTKLPVLLSQPLFSSSHTCAKRLLALGSW